MFRLWLLCLICFSLPTVAQQNNEAVLVSKIFSALQHHDADAYASLVVGADSLADWVVSTAPKNATTYRKMLAVKNSEYYKIQYDTTIKAASTQNFTGFIEKATPLEINWGDVIFIRYELEKMRSGRGLITEKIAKLRMMGYVFFKDQLMQKTYCFSVADILNVNGNWYAGELINIYEAKTKEEYQKRYKEEQKLLRDIALGIVDTATATKQKPVDGDEHEKPSTLKEVVERRYYKGKFDDEISVSLYVRYIKGPCEGGVCSWDALFKFGDQDEYVKMVVSRTTDGKWQFNEDLGGMELVLEGKEYTGSYAANSDKTEYEVAFHQIPISPKKLKLLDEILDLGVYGH